MGNTRPYADSWRLYAKAGWTPIPLPPGQKTPPPADYTGASQLLATRSTYRAWAEATPSANVGIVMPDTVVCLDVDAYKDNWAAFDSLTERLGDLPPTAEAWRGEDSVKLFFRVPEGTHLAKGSETIDVLQWFHRYAMVWPSVHPSGEQVEWENTNGVPAVDSLPDLPAAWLEFFSAAKPEHNGSGFGGGVDEWLDSLPDRPLSAVLAHEYNRKLKRFSSPDKGRHDTMVELVGWLVHLGAEGHNVADALDDLYMEFTAALRNERDGDHEFSSAVGWAVRSFGGSK